ncbi:amidohydrolase family protein [Nocardiopsis tropica]|uniref:Amidohydrolase family protein n=1 Tax=Nocardiopsis tropica TaxID=109330 RepID=A0ABU7KN28_9ACTN|nr:amidohydrolase family protein [Nocardiopsis umidischolae]MEE2050701.1 amidohydrolase family protein [Nocardiopsis umidischolae]
MGAVEGNREPGGGAGGHPPWHLRATVLPSGLHTDLWVASGRISSTPVLGATSLPAGGFVFSGLVDAHVHPGVTGIGEPLDEARLREDLTALARAGTTLVRVPGSPSRLPAWVRTEPGLPRVLSAGVPITAPGRFFPGWGRPHEPGDVPGAAAEESAAADGWAKLIADWFDEDGVYTPSFSPPVLAEAVRRVHAAGGRVAAHTQHADSGRDAVAAGVDSVEHGMHLPFEALGPMAGQGTALVPTAVTFAAMEPAMTGGDVPEPVARWYREGWARHPELVRRAHGAGVTVLAGTDLPVGSLPDEIRWLHRAGLPLEDALGAASWTARAWLGLPGLAEGAPADLVVLAEDPRLTPDALADPLVVMVGGRLVAPAP